MLKLFSFFIYFFICKNLPFLFSRVLIFPTVKRCCSFSFCIFIFQGCWISPQSSDAGRFFLYLYLSGVLNFPTVKWCWSFFLYLYLSVVWHGTVVKSRYFAIFGCFSTTNHVSIFSAVIRFRNEARFWCAGRRWDGQDWFRLISIRHKGQPF